MRTLGWHFENSFIFFAVTFPFRIARILVLTKSLLLFLTAVGLLTFHDERAAAAPSLSFSM